MEIWSDIACPWCAVGKRRFETALSGFEHRDEVVVRWRSFELDPDAPRERDEDAVSHLAAKYGITHEQAAAFQRQMTETAAGEGWEFRLDRLRSGNTFDAHRLLQLAAELGHQDAVAERLMRAYLSEAAPIGDPGTLVRLVAEAGMDVTQARQVLESDRYADAVRTDERDAARLGITAVPFFVIDRAYGVAGAQPATTLRAALQQAWTESRPAVPDGSDAEGGACAV